MAETCVRHPNTACARCGKPIYRRPSQIARGPVYCNRSCYGEACRNETSCVICGTPILASLHKKTCSKECWRKLVGVSDADNYRERMCAYCGKPFRIPIVGTGRPRLVPTEGICPACSVTKIRQRTKERAVALLGGRCAVCGYSRCAASLQFHHRDPKVKDFRISEYSRSWQRIEPELRKCILLCANCHAEYHAGMLDLTPFTE